MAILELTSGDPANYIYISTSSVFNFDQYISRSNLVRSKYFKIKLSNTCLHPNEHPKVDEISEFKIHYSEKTLEKKKKFLQILD